MFPSNYKMLLNNYVYSLNPKESYLNTCTCTNDNTSLFIIIYKVAKAFPYVLY